MEENKKAKTATVATRIFGFVNTHNERRVEARRRLPMNWGSMAKPEGCGKPKVCETQPAQSKVCSLEIPQTSKIHCPQQTTQIMILDIKKALSKVGRNLDGRPKSGER